MESVQAISKIPESQECLFFGELLVAKGLLSRDELLQVLNQQREQGGRLGEVLLRLKMLSDEDITAALSEHFDMEYVRFDNKKVAETINMEVARLLPESIATRFCLVAIGEENNKVVVAMADPLNVIAIDTVTLKLKRQIKPAISSPREIHRAIELIYHGSDVEEQQLRSLVEIEINDESKLQEDVILEDIVEPDSTEEASANKAPVIRFVDLLMSQAVKSRASDIHIEPQEHSTVIRMRIDGVLRDMVPPPKKMQAAVVARIKIVAHMDIAERRLPQDGRFKMKISGRAIDVRVSTIPTIYGEKVVMRILDATAVKHNLDQLGIEPKYLAEFKDMLGHPHGIIIVTGPTGSGKSTSLYSALNYLKDPTKNITTVEDPVEYRLAGINQIQVKPEIELDFAKCLRAILRQDPDIVLIGEIRDKETVEIAIKASLTGHLVLSTFHTNDAPSAISRLIHMGIERYLLASALNLIIAQRLVRRICEHCKEPVTLNDEVKKRLHLDENQSKDAVFYHGRGCAACGGTGYLGRLPIFEFLVVDNEISEKIINSESESQIRAAARKKGYGGLLESGAVKVLQGLTTAEEVVSIAFTGKG
ncbi:MAG: Flp pilus assembly complex ATPase component TadA [Sedimentisphaerales bacterium]|nr:Flp pilus assembly complex ATPase component TadA [Sedimentisphaerales bacterium]